MTASRELIRFEDLRVYYYASRGTIRAVDGVTFSLPRGEILGLVGESGSGKSTLGLSTIRLVPPPGRIVGGRLLFDGTNLLNLRRKEIEGIRGRRIGMVFQDPMTSLNPLMRIGEHIVQTLRLRQKMRKEDAVKKTVSVLESVGIPAERFGDYPHQFSGGMRQRVMIALAISLNPDLVIADEPTTALDVIVQTRILDLLASLRETHGMSLMLITHDLAVVLERCDRVAVMYAGELVEYGASTEIGRKPLHPYTKALLEATPNIAVEHRPAFILGSPPDMTKPPSGCRFHPRCPYAMEICRERSPPRIVVDHGRSVRCYLYGGET